MKYTVRFTSKFKKNYKKIQKRGLKKEDLEKVVTKLQNGEKLEEKYRDHVLKGSYNGYHECHIQPDWLLIYAIKEDILILTLVDTGTHSDLF
ncbi:type II toxin-antitoxin system YafQ family toxin [Candidatus Saccharibacteria bacterium]|nr:type II toxin-antitoxin system YafQ family toxin [Candidatus Saccharibacteria bacterium]